MSITLTKEAVACAMRTIASTSHKYFVRVAHATLAGFSVYLRVQSPLFSEIWWKPDFKEFDINPHVTMFETSSQHVARAVENFLRSERIEIFTLNFTLTVYTSKQLNLFETSIDPVLGKKRAYLGRWDVKPGILQRATLLHEQLVSKSRDCRTQ